MKIAFLTPVQQSWYGTPIFIIRKKERTLSFITDYRRLNQKLVRKPYQLPRIGDIMQHLEGLQYVAALDLNMGCAFQEIYSKQKLMSYLVISRASKLISMTY